MMKLLPVLTLATLAPLAAAAEGIALGPDLTLTGDLALQHTDDSWEKITDFTADLRFSWRPATDTALSFGLEGGIESFVALSQDWGDHSLWLAAVVGFDGFDLRLGAPRPVSDTMALLPDFGMYRHDGKNLNQYERSTVVYRAGRADQARAGLSLQSSGDSPFAWGLSLHDAGRNVYDGKESAYSLEAVGQYSLGNITLSAQFVQLETDGNEAGFSYETSGLSTVLGLRYAADGLVLGLTRGDVDTGAEEVEFTRLHAGYEFGFGLGLRGDFMRFEDSSGYGDQDIWSLGAVYSLDNGVYFEAGTGKWLDDKRTSLTIGYRF